MKKFKAELKIIGINPFVFVPNDILQFIFLAGCKNKGAIPISGTVNGKKYRQTLVRYNGEWRLYVNTSMLPNSPKRIGEILELTIAFDAESREIKAPDKFISFLNLHKEAKKIFDSLSFSRKQEIVRYLVKLKTEESLDKNIVRAIDFLMGKERFVGRDKP